MTNSSESLTRLTLELVNRSEVMVSFESTIAIILITIALSGNMLVCAAICRNRNLRTKQNVYIANLAISDLVMAVFVMPLTLGALTIGRWPFKKGLCQMQGFVATMAGMVSLKTMTLIAVHRYFKVVDSRVYKKIFKKSSVVASIVIAWVIALSVQTSHVARFDYIFHPGKMICFFKFNSKRYFNYVVALVVLILIPLLVIAYCYYKVYRRVSDHKAKSFRTNSTVNKAISLSEIKINHLLFALIVSFALCWVVPVSIVDFTVLYFGELVLPRFIYVAYTVLMGLSSCVNPIIYNALSREFRKEFKRLIACGYVCGLRRVRQVRPVKVGVITTERLDYKENSRSAKMILQPKEELLEEHCK